MTTFDLESAAFFADPTAELDRLRAHAPVHYHPELGAYVLTRYADVVQVVRHPAFSVDRGGAIGRSARAEVADALAVCNRFFGRFMVFADAPLHSRLRTSVVSAFTPARMRRLEGQIDATADALLDAMWAERGAIDFVAAFADPLPTRITAHLLGLPEARHLALQRMTDDFFAFFGAGDASAEIVLRARDAIEDARALFTEVVAQKRTEGGDDVLSALIRSESDAPTLTEDELLGVCMTLVAGAYGTTSFLLANAVACLLEGDREHYQALVREPGLAAAVTEETLRIDGPALALVRRATEATRLSGVDIPENARLYAMLHAANHDPEVFPHPGRFDLTRGPSRHLGLGAGMHFCLGASLTRLETTRALMRLAVRCPALVLHGPARRAGNLSMRGYVELGVRVRPVAQTVDSARAFG